MKESGEEQFLPDLPVGWQSAKEAIPAQSKKILPLNHYQKLWIVVLEGEVFVSDGRLFNFLGRGQALKVQGECVVKIANGQANAAQILQIQNSPP